MILTLTEEQKKYIVETVIRRLKEGATLSETEEAPNPNVRMVDFEDPNEISKYINDVYFMFYSTYKDKGGFFGAKDAQSLMMKTSKLTIITDGNHIYSAATYNNARGGQKTTGMGNDGSSVGKNGVRQIIQRDIKCENLHHWCEASDAIEHLFAKYGGRPIPSFYAPDLLRKPVEDITIIDDYHYSRIIGTNRTPTTKVIFGFRDSRIRSEIVHDLSDRTRKMMNAIERSLPPTNEGIDGKDRDLSLACLKITAVSDELDEMQGSELIPEQVAIIKDCIATLQRYGDNNDAKRCIALGEYILDTCTVLEFHTFDFN